MPHCCVVLARWIYFKLEAGFFFEVLLSLCTPYAKEENHIEPKSFEIGQERGWVTELMKISTAPNIPFQLPVCVLHFLFCGVLSLQLWHLAFSISFDLLNLGSEDSFWPLSSGSACKYLLIEWRNLGSVDLL